MPSTDVLEQKQKVVENIADRLSNATAGVFVDYKGITVEEDTKLRFELRKSDVEYSVVKNTLTKFAAKKVGLEGLDDILNGTTALATSTDDVIIAAKIVNEYAKSHSNFQIKAGFVDGKVLSADEVITLASLPSKEELIAKMLGSLNAPISGLVNVLNGNIRGLVVALNAIAEQKSA
ncbi:MAG: 50S ribosomal protein L10 [Clostridia bacterium]